MEGIITSHMRLKESLTLNDIAANAHITPGEANKFVQGLISRNVVKAQERERKAIYTLVQKSS